MGKHRIAAGEDIDVLDEAQARRLLELAFERMRDQGEDDINAEESGKTDGTGALVLGVYTVPPGRVFRITRLVVSADGFTAAAPFTNAAGAIQVFRSGVLVDFVNLANGIPALSIDNKDTGTRWRNGEQVELRLIGGPVNTVIQVAIAGFLRNPRALEQPTLRGRLRAAAAETAGQIDAP